MFELTLSAVLALVWVPVYLFLAFYYLIFYLRDRDERTHLLYFLMLLCQTWYTFGAFGFYAAADFDAALAWQRFQLLGAIFGFPSLALFCYHFVGRPARRWVFGLYYGAAVGFALADLFTPWFFTGAALPREFSLAGLHFRFLDAVPGWAGALFFLWGGVQGLHALGVTYLAWRRGQPGAGLLFLALLVLVACAIGDMLGASGLYEAPYVIEHAFMLFAFVVAYILQSRVLVAQRERRHERRRLRVLSEVVGAVNRTDDLHATLTAVRTTLAPYLPLDRISLLLLDERGAEVEVRLALGLGVQAGQVGSRLALDQVVAPHYLPALQRGEVAVEPDVARGTPRTAVQAELVAMGIHAVAMLPLRADDELIGIIGLASTTPAAYSPQHVELLEHLAADLALTVIRQRLVQDRQRRQAELEAANRDLARQAAELERVNRELKSLDAMKSDLLANVSHELRTPLVSIRGYTEMILDERLGPVSPEQTRGLEVALRNAGRLLMLIDNLLDYAKLKDGQLTLATAPLDLRDVLEECLEAALPRAEERGLTLRRDLQADGPLRVSGDRARLGQVFDNLLSNAIKFNRTGGEIRVEAGRGRDGAVRAAVADTGIGIAAADQPRVFDRFYQADSTSTRSAGGTGIGLAIVRELVRLHDGEVRMRSREGEGTTFVVLLPPVSPEAEASALAGPSSGNV